MDFDERAYEKANELAQGQMDAAIERHRAAAASHGPGRETCLDCGKPIPEKRRLAVAAIRCAPCQTKYEKRQ